VSTAEQVVTITALALAVIALVWALSSRADWKDRAVNAETSKALIRADRDNATRRRKDAERDSAHWQAVAAGHPSADPHAFGRHAARLVLTDDLNKSRSGK
jgi:hypothetical protein